MWNMAQVSALKPSRDDLYRMYVDEMLTARQIAEQCKVRHITVLRWLRAAGIERRKGKGAFYLSGGEPPSAEDLRRMIHVEHLGYSGVAAKYGVDMTAVPYWLEKYGIEKPTIWATRRKGVVPPMPSEAELRHRLGLGHSLTTVAAEYDCARSTIAARCQRYGIPVARDGWRGGHRLHCIDGHAARSTYEQRVDDWLYQHGVAHELEPAYPWDRRYRADFLVGQTYIEVWGVRDNDRYAERRRMKIARCRQAGLDLIGINHWQFAAGKRWWRPLERLVSEELGSSLFDS